MKAKKKETAIWLASETTILRALIAAFREAVDNEHGGGVFLAHDDEGEIYVGKREPEVK